MKKLIILAILAAFHTTAMAADNSMQLHENIHITFNERFSAHAFIFETWRDDMSNLYYYENMVGFLYNFHFEWLTIGPMYRQAFSENPAAGTWKFEHAPNIWLIFSHTVNPGLKVNLFWLNRHEYRITETWHNYRMRNFFQVMLPSLPVQPYLAGEFFYSRRQGKVYLFHFQPGLTYRIWGPTTLTLYYRFYFSESKNWKNSDNTLGFEVTLNLKFKQ